MSSNRTKFVEALAAYYVEAFKTRRYATVRRCYTPLSLAEVVTQDVERGVGDLNLGAIFYASTTLGINQSYDALTGYLRGEESL